MPFDPFFSATTKPKLKSILPYAESVEMQLGRSDFLLGEPLSKNPFPKDRWDAAEWRKGWIAQKSLQPHNPLSSPSQPVKRSHNPPPRQPDGFLGLVESL